MPHILALAIKFGFTRGNDKARQCLQSGDGVCGCLGWVSLGFNPPQEGATGIVFSIEILLNLIIKLILIF